MHIELISATPKSVAKLIFSLLDVFNAIGIPLTDTNRALERMSKACLATGKIKKSFQEAVSSDSGEFLRTRDIINFENANYGEKIADASYDDIRRKDLKLLIEAGVVVKSSSQENQATNNPSRGYALSPAFVALLQKYNSEEWKEALEKYLSEAKSLKEELERRRMLQRVPVTLPNGQQLSLSYGEHNDLQKAIIEQFLPIYGFGAEVLYVGDTSDKFLFMDKEGLEKVKFFTLEHEELPDIVAYSKTKNLLYLIEAFHSTGEWSEIRVGRVKQKLSDSKCTADVVFFTAFENKDVFRQKAKDIAWETEVWIADCPEHLVHFNGFKFLEVH